MSDEDYPEDRPDAQRRVHLTVGVTSMLYIICLSQLSQCAPLASKRDDTVNVKRIADALERAYPPHAEKPK